jgi:phosphate/sulfate permease
MDATSTATIITSVVSDIGDVMVAVLPVVLGLAAVLIGLFFGWRLIKKNIGKAKG